MPNGMIGRKLTEEHKMKLWNGQKHSFTKPELMVLNSYYGLKYTGNGVLWLTFSDGTKKNPDMTYMDYNIAIEVYGNYWHRDDDPDDLVEKYNEIGWDCLVLWERDIYAHEKAGSLGDEIDRFVNPDIYEPCVSPHDQDYGINASLYSDELNEGFV